MKGYCTHCEELIEITPTDIALEYRTEQNFERIPVGSSRYNQLVLHPDKRAEPVDGKWPICKGSNQLI